MRVECWLLLCSPSHCMCDARIKIRVIRIILIDVAVLRVCVCVVTVVRQHSGTVYCIEYNCGVNTQIW